MLSCRPRRPPPPLLRLLEKSFFDHEEAVKRQIKTSGLCQILFGLSYQFRLTSVIRGTTKRIPQTVSFSWLRRVHITNRQSLLSKNKGNNFNLVYRLCHYHTIACMSICLPTRTKSASECSGIQPH